MHLALEMQTSTPNLNRKNKSQQTECMQTGYSIEFSRSVGALNVARFSTVYSLFIAQGVYILSRKCKNNKSQVSVSQQRQHQQQQQQHPIATIRATDTMQSVLTLQAATHAIADWFRWKTHQTYRTTKSKTSGTMYRSEWMFKRSMKERER